MALTLADALIRRTEAGSAGHPGADAVEAAATLMAAASAALPWLQLRGVRDGTRLASVGARMADAPTRD